MRLFWFGALAQALVFGTRALLQRHRLGFVSRVALGSRWTRRQILARARAGQATLGDLTEYLISSPRGRRFLDRSTEPIMAYVRWRVGDDDTDADDETAQTRAREQEIWAALLTWLSHDRDWDLLLVALDARYTPAELVAHADGTLPITDEQARFLSALRPRSLTERILDASG